jgi:hypothetical protein
MAQKHPPRRRKASYHDTQHPSRGNHPAGQRTPTPGPPKAELLQAALAASAPFAQPAEGRADQSRFPRRAVPVVRSMGTISAGLAVSDGG